MSISVICGCGAKLKAPEGMAGKRVACPKCKQPVLIAARPTAPESPSATGSAVGDDPLGLAGTDLGEFGQFAPQTAPAEASGYSVAAQREAAEQTKQSAQQGLPQSWIIAGVAGGAVLLTLFVALIVWAFGAGQGPTDVVAAPESAVGRNPSTPAEPPANPAGPSIPASSGATPTEPRAATPAGSRPAGAPVSGSPGAERPANAPRPNSPPAGPDSYGPPSVPQLPRLPGGGGNSAPSPPKPPTDPRLLAASPQYRTDNELKMILMRCPPGRFSYGRIGGVIDYEFWLGRTEVTQREWTTVMATAPWGDLADPEFPAVGLSWLGAVEFCKRLTEFERNKGRLDSGLEYRLPTEAEWTYAAFAPRPKKDSAYFWSNRNSDGRPRKVATKEQNKWGLYDLLGNAAEFTLDRFSGGDEARRNPYGGSSPFRWFEAENPARAVVVARGGDWIDGGYTPTARETFVLADYKLRTGGFRVALAPPAKPTQPPSPPSQEDRLWYVLSKFKSKFVADASDPDHGEFVVQVDWKRTQGAIQPGKKYHVIINTKIVGKSYISIGYRSDAVAGDAGTVHRRIPLYNSNGRNRVFSAEIRELLPDGRYSTPASSELELGDARSASKPIPLQ